MTHSDIGSHFYVAEGKDIACRHIYDKTGQLENDKVQGASVILDRSKPVKLGHLLTGSFLSGANRGIGESRINDVRSSDAEQR